jgi:hypothetical protein
MGLGSEIHVWDPEKTYSGSQGQGPRSGSATLLFLKLQKSSSHLDGSLYLSHNTGKEEPLVVFKWMF